VFKEAENLVANFDDGRILLAPESIFNMRQSHNAQIDAMEHGYVSKYATGDNGVAPCVTSSMNSLKENKVTTKETNFTSSNASNFSRKSSRSGVSRKSGPTTPAEKHQHQER